MENIYTLKNKLVIPCEGSSDIELTKNEKGVTFTYDYGACYSKTLTNDEIDLLISFLQSSKL